MKKFVKFILVLVMMVQMIPMQQVHAREKTFLEEVTSIVETKVKSYASSIQQSNADTSAALALATHGISGSGTLKMNEKHALNATIWNSKLGQTAYIEGISETITKLQQLPENKLQIGYCVNWGTSEKQYFYNINTSNESIYTAYNYEYNGPKNSYDDNLTWIAGSTNADFTIKEKSIKDKTIVYEISYIIYDDFNFENGKGSVPQQVLFLISSKLFKEFHWETKGKFEVEVPNSCDHTTHNYHLVLDDNKLKSETTNEFDLNTSKLMTTKPIEKGNYFSLDKAIVLYHDREWVLEYTVKNPKRLFGISATSNISCDYYQIMGAHNNTLYSYLYTYYTILENNKIDKAFNCFGYKSDKSVNNNHSNTIRLENEIDSNGSNRIHITIIDNDLQIVIIDSYIDSYYQVIKYKIYDSTTNESMNKKDLYISYVGNNQYYLDVEEFSMKVWENGKENKTDSTYVVSKVLKPTCSEQGYTEYTCSKCGHVVKKNYTSKLGHNYSSQVIAPTCIEKGYTTYTCRICKDTYKDNYVDALGHVFTNYISDKNSTCTKDGTKTSKCDRCDVTDTVSDNGSMLNHSLGEWFTTVEPNCEIKGEQKRECSNCEYNETQVIDALGHEWNNEYTIDKEPTYTKEGSKSIHCSRCDVIKEGSVVSIPKLEIEITSVSLNKTSITLTKGDSERLIAIINPSNTTQDKTLTWSSSDESVISVDQNGNVTAVSAGTASITVTTTNNKTASCTVTVKDIAFPFTDVGKGKWYYSFIKEAYEAGLMSGVTSTTFAPDRNMTRGMIATVIHRIAGKPDVAYTGRFPDVGSKSYCATAVEWAAKNKVVSGYANGNFGPNDNITRQDVAVILYNYARSLGLDVTNDTDLSQYVDYKNVSAYARPAIEWAVSVGILSGATDKDTGDIYLNPKDNATRAECAKMLLVASVIYKK